ncbi:hypothetical protein EDD22DRAFT_962947 [Suillus occidentalis]|nr:hypothetical protein EDD22DRAFT_962947 [Suillus occidentalis]
MGPERSKLCDICDQNIKPRGWTTHRKACEARADKRRRDQVVVDAIRKDKAVILEGRRTALNNPTNNNRFESAPHNIENRNPPDFAHDPDADLDYGIMIDHQIPDHATVIEPEPVANTFPAHVRDDIKVEHHPSSGIKTTVHSFETFKRHPAPSLVPPPDRRPWLH